MSTGGRLRAALLAGVALLCLAPSVAGAQQIEGFVYYDDNANGSYDDGESGVSGVAVSDGGTIVTTNAQGHYELMTDDVARFVFICIPSGTQPVTQWYLPVSSDGPHDFPLARISQEGPLVFAQVSDIHYAPTPEEFKLGLRDRQMGILPDSVLDAVCEEINEVSIDFVLLAGDLAADSKYPEPEIVDAWIGAMADRFTTDINAPVYGVIGNHDIIRDETIGKTIYENYFGPTYYAFDIKGTHFVVLDTQRLEGTKLVYTSTERQLAWLEQDLAGVAEDSPIVVFCHEPSYDWVDTPEGEAMFTLLQQAGITALLNGHWHTNEVLREEPFYELTSGAVCGAWWEGPGPDGSGFGYRIFRLARGVLDSIWRESDAIDLSSPTEAVLTWADRLEAEVWGAMDAASYAWDGGEPVPLNVYWNGLWSSVASNINVSTLSDGYHELEVAFVDADGSRISLYKSFRISNLDVTLEEIFDHPDTYQGKVVAAPELTVRAAMGSDISAYDGTETIIIGSFPYAVTRNDIIGLVGMYHPTSASPIKVYDDIFYTVYDGEEE